MRIRILLLSIAFLAGLTAITGPAVAQSDAGFSAIVRSVATDIADITIVDTAFVELDGMTHTMALAEVQATNGSLPSRIVLKVRGGTSPGGEVTRVSHQPVFTVGNQAKVALVLSSSQGFGGLFGDEQPPIYSIVGGLDGVQPLTDAFRANAAGDFVLLGHQINEFPKTYYVNSLNSGLSRAATIAAVQRGFDMWEDDLGSDIDFTYAGHTSATANLTDNKNTAYWTVTPDPGDTWLAQASWRDDGSGLQFDIRFNRDYRWLNGAGAAGWDIGTTTAHEVGHPLGFNHAPDSSNVMYEFIFGGTVKPLGPADRKAAAYLYPTQATDPARVTAVANLTAALESYGETNGTYAVAGAGWKGKGEGWYQTTGTNFSVSIASRLSQLGYFPNGIPTDPDGRDFMVYRCKDRVAVFAHTDTAGAATSDRNWWTSNGCTDYPAGRGYNYLKLAAPLPNNDDQRISAVSGVIDAVESYGQTNGTYTVTGAGWKGKGEGWYQQTGTNFSVSIASRLSQLGYFPNGIPTDPDGRDFMVYRCKDRIAVFANTNSAGAATSDRNWWTSNGCTDYPAGRGYNYLKLSAPLPNNDSQRISAVSSVMNAIESYGQLNDTYTISGAGWKGKGEGWYEQTGTNFSVSIASRLSQLGYFPNGIPTDPSGRDFRVYRCGDRIAVFANTNSAGTATSDRNWWTNNSCTDYPIERGYTYFMLSSSIG